MNQLTQCLFLDILLCLLPISPQAVLTSSINLNKCLRMECSSIFTKASRVVFLFAQQSLAEPLKRNNAAFVWLRIKKSKRTRSSMLFQAEIVVPQGCSSSGWLHSLFTSRKMLSHFALDSNSAPSESQLNWIGFVSFNTNWVKFDSATENKLVNKVSPRYGICFQRLCVVAVYTRRLQSGITPA